ncbi:hypothetical protein BDR07DRAFT_1548776 [Suillus spraguei]|nr:hypothetical protein BDR07DRAFT_1548776 [Suillus spraguei]
MLDADFLRQGNLWTCLCCPTGCFEQDIHHAIRHENTQKHRTETTHYTDELCAAQTAALNEPHLQTNPLLDAIFIASGLLLNPLGQDPRQQSPPGSFNDELDGGIDMEVDFGELNPPPPSMEDMHARIVSSVSISLRHMVDHGFNPSAVDSDNGEGDVPEDEDEFVVNMNAEDELEVILWQLKQHGVHAVPSIHQIKSVGHAIDGLCGVEINCYIGCLGHTYYMISLEFIVKMAFANPLVRSVLEVYPEDSGPKLEEIRQARCWLEEHDARLLTPMYCVEGRIARDFYTDEPTLLKNGMLCMPFRSDCCDPTGCIKLWVEPMMNPWRLKANGHRVVAYPVLLYCDDTSGNRSKKWNEHNTFLMNAAGLPREHMQREYNLSFICTSNIAPPLEMLEGIVEQLELCQETGIWAYDCSYHDIILVIISVLALLGDNPMQSEFACHAGLMSKFFCCCCWVKGKDVADMLEVDGVKKETVQGMVSRITRFMKVGAARTTAETQSISHQMLENASTLARQKENVDLQTSTGVKDTILHFFLDKLEKARKSLSGHAARQATREAYSRLPANTFSPVWRIRGLNPHSDMPIEILHVVLLGFLKYFWPDAVECLSAVNKATVEARLSSLDVSGLGPNVAKPHGHTLVHYAGSLVGRDFCLISQVAVFVLYDMLETKILDAWAALCVLVPLLWMPTIDNLNNYMPKFHLILHIVDHIRRFGPAITFAMEVHESYNSIIRGWSINSNQMAPSHDIARRAAGLLRLRHLLSAGYFEVETDKSDGTTQTELIQAGVNPRIYGEQPSIITRKLGFPLSESFSHLGM